MMRYGGCVNEARGKIKMTFEREDRYIVIKRTDLSAIEQQVLLGWLSSSRIKTREGLVIESDWPEYEPVWKMIEDRVSK